MTSFGADDVCANVRDEMETGSHCYNHDSNTGVVDQMVPEQSSEALPRHAHKA